MGTKELGRAGLLTFQTIKAQGKKLVKDIAVGPQERKATSPEGSWEGLPGAYWLGP